jgi:hypothetical protein
MQIPKTSKNILICKSQQDAHVHLAGIYILEYYYDAGTHERKKGPKMF